MTIDLRTIPTFWATIARNTDRHRGMNAMFTQVGMTKTTMLTGPIVKPYTIGIAATHLDGLTRQKPPFLILEDDCQATQDWAPTIEVPDAADAVYLGTSAFGNPHGISNFGDYRAANYDEHYLQLNNMLSMHAVLYLSERWVDHVVQLLRLHILQPQGGCDDSIARTMNQFVVLGARQPFFFQNDGHSQPATKMHLIPNVE